MTQSKIPDPDSLPENEGCETLDALAEAAVQALLDAILADDEPEQTASRKPE